VASVGVSSVKSQIGHLLSAAGIAGLVKVLLAVERGRLLPTLHCAEPNPRLALDSSPLFVVHNAAPWPRSGRRWAGVSAFGLGGTNAHVVVADAEPFAGRVAREPLRLAPLERRRLWHERPAAPATRPATPPPPEPAAAEPPPATPGPNGSVRSSWAELEILEGVLPWGPA